MTDKEYTDLYSTEWKKVVNYIAKLLGRDYERDAEDCAQDVFVQMWNKRERISSPNTYLYTAAKNEALRLKELSQREELIGDDRQMERLLNIQAGI